MSRTRKQRRHDDKSKALRAQRLDSLRNWIQDTGLTGLMNNTKWFEILDWFLDQGWPHRLKLLQFAEPSKWGDSICEIEREGLVLAGAMPPGRVDNIIDYLELDWVQFDLGEDQPSDRLLQLVASDSPVSIKGRILTIAGYEE